MSEEREQASIEHILNRDVGRAIINGTRIGGIVGVSMSLSASNSESAGLGVYLASRSILREWLAEKPFWAEAMVEGGLSVSIIMILNQAITDAWQLAIKINNNVDQRLPLPTDMLNSINRVSEIAKSMPELFIYLIFFLILTNRTWRRGIGELREISN